MGSQNAFSQAYDAALVNASGSSGYADVVKLLLGANADEEAWKYVSLAALLCVRVQCNVAHPSSFSFLFHLRT